MSLESLIHIFKLLFDDFLKRIVFWSDVSGAVGILSWEGVLRVLWVHGAFPKSAFTFLFAPGVSFGAAKGGTIGFEKIVFRLLRFWERLRRRPKAWFAAKEVPGTPPLCSIWRGAKMQQNGATFFL